jgi:3-hydroxyisobutyrate dehydrogenase
MDIAFIGLGSRGGPMALNLLKAGHQLRVFDLVSAASEAAQAAGAHVAQSPVAAVKGAAVVISMLPASRHVESLY